MKNKNKIDPPKVAEWLLNKIVDSKNNPAIKGDFEEEFNQIQSESNINKARIKNTVPLLE